VVSRGLAIVVYGSIAVSDFMTAKPPRKKPTFLLVAASLFTRGNFEK
jgi:hypothetical protein